MTPMQTSAFAMQELRQKVVRYERLLIACYYRMQQHWDKDEVGITKDIEELLTVGRRWSRKNRYSR